MVVDCSEPEDDAVVEGCSAPEDDDVLAGAVLDEEGPQDEVLDD